MVGSSDAKLVERDRVQGARRIQARTALEGQDRIACSTPPKAVHRTWVVTESCEAILHRLHGSA